MAVTVIKDGRFHECKCSNCHSILSYNPDEDVIESKGCYTDDDNLTYYQMHIKCPVYGNHQWVGERCE